MKANDQKKSESSNRRKTYIVNAPFQWKYAMTAACAVFTMTCILGSVMYVVLHEQARQRFIDPNVAPSSVTTSIFFFSVFLGLLSACGAGIWGAISTNKICGPLFVVERYLMDISEGRLPNMRALRKKDHFKDFYSTFVGTVNTLKDVKRAELSTINQCLEEVRSAMNGDPTSRDESLASVVNALESLRAAHLTAINETDTEQDFTESSVTSDTPQPLSIG